MIDKEEVLNQLDRQRDFLFSIKTYVEAQFNIKNKWGTLIEGITIAMDIVRRMPDKETQKGGGEAMIDKEEVLQKLREQRDILLRKQIVLDAKLEEIQNAINNVEKINDQELTKKEAVEKRWPAKKEEKP